MEIRPALAPYVPLARMLAQTFGQDCEVVLHDLENPAHSVVYVANGVVTGRKVGDKVRIIPVHICPVCNLYDRAYLISGGEVVQELEIACRGKLQ